MKKLRNMLCSGIASAMLLSALPVHAANMVTTTDGHGESETVEETVRFINEHNDWGIVKANGSVQVGSQTVDLLVTFQSPEAAMANFKNKYGDELKQIQRDHGWDVLNDENYHEYYHAILTQGDQYFSDEEINTVYGFFDLYENEDQNKEMREMVTKLVTAPYKEDREASLQKIDSISPSYNQPVSRAASTKTVRYIGDIDVTKATNYAKKYAKNANPAYKNFMSTGGDCTNFASQIAYAGGLRYAPVWQPYTKPWINANSFGIVWGKKEKSTKWSIFVKKLKPGMFIAADFGGDGALDHVAYVAANGSSSSNKYIAQHSAKAEGFYYARSDSTTSNWDKASNSCVLWIIGNNAS